MMMMKKMSMTAMRKRNVGPKRSDHLMASKGAKRTVLEVKGKPK